MQCEAYPYLTVLLLFCNDLPTSFQSLFCEQPDPPFDKPHLPLPPFPYHGLNYFALPFIPILLCFCAFIRMAGIIQRVSRRCLHQQPQFYFLLELNKYLPLPSILVILFDHSFFGSVLNSNRLFSPFSLSLPSNSPFLSLHIKLWKKKNTHTNTSPCPPFPPSRGRPLSWLTVLKSIFCYFPKPELL